MRPPDTGWDGEAVERVLVAPLPIGPASKLTATRWVDVRVAVEGLAEVSGQLAYLAMDVLLGRPRS